VSAASVPGTARSIRSHRGNEGLRAPAPRLQVVRTRRAGRRRTPFVIVAGLLVAGLLFGVVALQAMVSQQSFDIQRSSRKVNDLRQQADELRLRVAQLSAPDRISREAARLGMVLPQEVHALTVPSVGAGTRASRRAGGR
jgi:cell division protein FtsL